MDERTHAIEAFRLIDALAVDLAVAVRSHAALQRPELDGRYGNPVYASTNRMCLAHAFLTLSKLVEFRKRFARVIPASCAPHLRSTIAEVKRRGILDFRSKVVAHILDKSTNQPFTPDEIDARVEAIVDHDVGQFLAWLGAAGDERDSPTVIGLARWIRDQIMEDFALVAEEIVE